MIQPYLDFHATAASITAEAERLVRESRHQRDELVSNIASEQATFANVMLPLAYMQNDFGINANVLSFYRQVSTDADIRAASVKAQTLFDDFHTECWMREDIFNLVDAVHHKNEEITKESSLFLETVHNRFTQSGLGIQDATAREQFKELQSHLNKTHAEFHQNLGCQTDEISFTLAELDGVPGSIIEQLDIDSGSNELRVDLSNPTHRNILSYATKGDTRKELYLAIDNRCRANASLVQEAVRLRYKIGKLLGFANYAASRLQSRMAKTPDRVNEFLADMRSKLMPHGLASLQVLKDLKESDMKSDTTSDTTSDAKSDEKNIEFFLWDYEFYHNRMLKSQLSIDRTQIKEYFPLQTTTTAILNLVAQLFGISFNEIKATDSKVWDADVQMFAVHDNEAGGGGFLGYLYLDLFRRDGKYPHESCFSLQPGFTRKDGTRHYPSTALLCAFSKPTPSKPCLLSHFEVITMLHELGHGIHDLVSKTQYSQFHGPEGVPVDFGELPSQMLEYWCWTPSQLKSFSHHYSYLSPEMLAVWKDKNEGKAQPALQIPDELIDGLTKASRATFGPLFLLDQVHRASFDLAIHQICSDEEAQNMDITVLWNKSRKDIGLISGQEVYNGNYTHGQGYTTTTHLMITDYAAGYYAYLYSKAYAADLFYSEFQDEALNPERFQRYRKCVLESGGSRDVFQNLVDFLGREPAGGAFYNSLLD